MHSMLQTEQPSGASTHSHTFATLGSQSSSLKDTEVHCMALGSSPTSYSPKSLNCSESAGGSSPSAKHSKKKARNRPPKHIRKGTAVTHRAGDADSAPGQEDSGELLIGDMPGSGRASAMPTIDQQLADHPQSRVMSAPINVPSRHITVSKDQGGLKIEAFSSPKWLGTGFSDQMESSRRFHAGTVPRCSGPMIDTSSGQFTYFANSMW
ncbi:hypothetical protein ABBQ32_011243 [Trebouxia sp. C0010 RCD-2024]